MLAEAEHETLESLLLNPGQPDARNLPAVIYVQEGKTIRASLVWRELVRDVPDYQPARTNLALVDSQSAVVLGGTAAVALHSPSGRRQSHQQCEQTTLAGIRNTAESKTSAIKWRLNTMGALAQIEASRLAPSTAIALPPRPHVMAARPVLVREPRAFPEASTAPALPTTIRDEMVEFYAFVFCQGGFRQTGMTFEQFLLVAAAVKPADLPTTREETRTRTFELIPLDAA